MVLVCSGAWATDYYVTTGGNDSTGDGSVGTPWLTLAKACTTVAAGGGHTINVGAGTFSETVQCELKTNVNIVGAGEESTTISAGAAFSDSLIKATSAEGTNGNQSISGITFDGNTHLGQIGVWIRGRSNVSIHDCTFTGWLYSGATVQGRETIAGAPPTIYATGNTFYNNTLTDTATYAYTVIASGASSATKGATYTSPNGTILTVLITVSGGTVFRMHKGSSTSIDASGNLTKTSGTGDATIAYSSTYETGGYGSLRFGGQDGMLIYNNTATQSGSGLTGCGYIFKYFDNGYIKNVKIYGNNIEKISSNNNTYNFSIEFWYPQGGVEVYDNTIIGTIDIGNARAVGNIDYALKIRNNTLGPATQQALSYLGVEVEDSSSDVIITRNLIRNTNRALYFVAADSSNTYIRRVWFTNNIIDGVGYDGATDPTSHGAGTLFLSKDSTNDFDSIYILNNTFYGRYNDALIGVGVHGSGAMSNIYVQNNVIQGFSTAPVYSNMQKAGSTIDGLYIQNNVMYGNGNSNAYLATGITPTNLTNSGHSTSDPLLDTDTWDLGTGSPALGFGIKTLGVHTDYNGKVRSAVNDAGAVQTSDDLSTVSMGGATIN
jgi:hypothetical protein